MEQGGTIAVVLSFLRAVTTGFKPNAGSTDQSGRRYQILLSYLSVPGYPLLLSLAKSLVVILNYVLTAEQSDLCGPEPYSPGKRPRTRSPLGEGPVMPRVPEKGALG